MLQRLFLYSFISFVLIIPEVARADSFLGIQPFSADIPDSNTFKDLHTALFKRLQYELLPHGIKPALINQIKEQDCAAIIGGKVELQSGSPVISFHLSSHKGSENETKIIPLNSRSIEEVVEVLALKARYFLEQNISGKVRISSVPLECDIFLNGIKIGLTPAELVLEEGNYSIRLEKEYMYPFTDTLNVTGGKDAALQASMQFKGHHIKPWIVTSSILTLCTAVSWIVESNLHLEYKRLPRGTSQDEFNTGFNRYRTANYLRITLLNSAILGWTVSGFQITRNSVLKKRLFGKQ